VEWSVPSRNHCQFHVKCAQQLYLTSTSMRQILGKRGVLVQGRTLEVTEPSGGIRAGWIIITKLPLLTVLSQIHNSMLWIPHISGW
jgi:hypothetical protein